MNPLLKLAVEAGPLAVFFVTYTQADDIFVATGAFMAATVVALGINYALERKIAILPLASGVFVLALGGLTLLLNDELFIKLKPTIVNALFCAILLGGLAFDRPLLRPLLGTVLPLDHAGWRKLTFRWAVFFAVLAVLNEIVWRNFETETWVNFKVFGIFPLTLVFSLAQLPLIRRHMVEPPQQEPAE